MMSQNTVLLNNHKRKKLKKSVNVLNFFLLSSFISLQVYAGTDEIFSETVDFWVNVWQGTGGKIAIIFAAVPAVGLAMFQKYGGLFALVVIYVFLMFLLPAILGGFTATIPVM